MVSAILALLVSLPPRPSAYVASWVTGAPVDALLAVCHRESRCKAIGIHQRDAWVSDSSWGGQVQLGHLDPKCQPRGKGQRWGTRGCMGLNAASHHQFMPRCYRPEWFDTPLISMLVAGRKWVAVCSGKRRSRWCPRRAA